jgi:hypothetical protein
VAVLVEVWQFTQEHGIDFTIKSPGPSICACSTSRRPVLRTMR